MAWHLTNSPATDGFQHSHDASHPWTVLSGADALKPGDAMVRSGHIELFASWVSAADHHQGAWVYSFNQTGETVRNPYANSTFGNIGRNTWSDLLTYTPIRYDNVIEDAAAPEAVEPGRSVSARADVNGDGRSDLGVLYDYGSYRTKLLVGLSTGATVPAPSVFRDSGVDGWDWSRTKV